MDKEKALIAERAAEWLQQIAQAGPEERKRFVKWLKESPQHSWEILLATSTDIAIHQLIRESGLKHTDICVPPNGTVEFDRGTLRPARAASREAESLAGWISGAHRIRWRLAVVFALSLVVLLTTVAIQAIAERTISTGPGEWRTARLVDGTILVVGPRTHATIDISDRHRVLHLTAGEVMAFVAKDAGRPFLVHTDLATAHAVGSAFAVQRRDPGRVSVTVKEGMVHAVRAARNSTSEAMGSRSQWLVLHAGERTQMLPDGAPLRAEDVDVEQELAWVQRRLRFDCTVGDAISEVNLRNKIQVQLLDPSLGQRRLVGTFSASDPTAFAKSLGLQLHLSVVDSHGTLLLVPSRATPTDRWQR